MKTFTRVRAFIWPIYAHEHKKFMAMFLMFFLVSFNYNILRTLKETLVVTVDGGAGAAVIPFIKVWAMFPGAIFMTFLFTWFSNRYSKERVFYIFMLMFLGYFFFFLFFLLPNAQALQLINMTDRLTQILPVGFQGFISMLRHWTLTSFYVMSELWGNIILTVLLWGFANQITKSEEAARFYGLLGLGANISGIIAAQLSVYFSQLSFDPKLPFGLTAWDQSVFKILSLVLLCGGLTMLVFYWLSQYLLQDASAYSVEASQQEKAMKGHISLKDSIIHLMKSPYLLNITLIVVAYNISMNLIEVLWKSQVYLLHPSASDYNWFINQVATWVGIIATFNALFISSNAIRILGWTFAALITPVIIFLTSVVFFGLLLGRAHFEANNFVLFGLAPLSLIVLMGAVQNALCRAAKYTLFDVTKEMAFVPLSSGSKLKGKSVIDGICNRFGKSGGSVIHQGLLIFFASFTMSAPYVALILLMILGVWMNAARVLGRSFNNLVSHKTEEVSI